MKNTKLEAEIVDLVIAEVDRARKLHPSWPWDRIHQAAIVAEEAGELVKATLEAIYQPEKGGGEAEIRKEAIHTAAMAIRLLLEKEPARSRSGARAEATDSDDADDFPADFSKGITKDRETFPGTDPAKAKAWGQEL